MAWSGAAPPQPLGEGSRMNCEIAWKAGGLSQIHEGRSRFECTLLTQPPDYTG
jgi:hypothetical protein